MHFDIVLDGMRAGIQKAGLSAPPPKKTRHVGRSDIYRIRCSLSCSGACRPTPDSLAVGTYTIAMSADCLGLESRDQHK